MKTLRYLAEWSNISKPYPTVAETIHGLSPQHVAHRDEGRHISEMGAVSVPSGKLVPISGVYMLKGPYHHISELRQDTIAPRTQQGESGLWVLQEQDGHLPEKNHRPTLKDMVKEEKNLQKEEQKH